MPAAYHRVDVTVEERPLSGRGRPSPHTPRPVKALRCRLKTPMSPQSERLARLEEEAGGFVLLTHGPTAGDLAQSARDILTGYKDQHGVFCPTPQKGTLRGLGSLAPAMLTKQHPLSPK